MKLTVRPLQALVVTLVLVRSSFVAGKVCGTIGLSSKNGVGTDSKGWAKKDTYRTRYSREGGVYSRVDLSIVIDSCKLTKVLITDPAKTVTCEGKTAKGDSFYGCTNHASSTSSGTSTDFIYIQDGCYSVEFEVCKLDDTPEEPGSNNTVIIVVVIAVVGCTMVGMFLYLKKSHDDTGRRRHQGLEAAGLDGMTLAHTAASSSSAGSFTPRSSRSRGSFRGSSRGSRISGRASSYRSSSFGSRPSSRY